jgi:DNA-binding response OmpR family regulator
VAFETKRDAGEEWIRVLLVEDDQEFAEMYRLKLEAEGYKVDLARDGEEGLRIATNNPPDLVFLDIRMPRMGGLEMLERLRQSPATSGLPVIILSNYGEDELRQRGLELGALEWLIKSSVTPTEVSKRISTWRKTPRN